MSALGNDTWTEYVENNCLEKQPVNITEIIDPLDEIDETEDSIGERESKPDSALVKEAMFPAKVVVSTIDLLLANIAGMISGGDKDKYKLTNDEKTAYTDVWANYLKEKQTELSPTMLLLIMSVSIVIPKLVEASKERKENKSIKVYQNTIQEQESEIKKLKNKQKNVS